MLSGLAGVGLVAIASYEKGYGLRSRFLAWLGARSYAIYMTHIPMFRVNLELWNYLARWRGFHLTAMEPSPVIASAAVLTLLAGEMNFRLLERPLIACGAANRVAKSKRKTIVRGANKVAGVKCNFFLRARGAFHQSTYLERDDELYRDPNQVEQK